MGPRSRASLSQPQTGKIANREAVTWPGRARDIYEDPISWALPWTPSWDVSWGALEGLKTGNQPSWVLSWTLSWGDSWGHDPDLPFLAFLDFLAFFSFQGIPCFFARFPLLSQGFQAFGNDKKSLFFC